MKVYIFHYEVSDYNLISVLYMIEAKSIQDAIERYVEDSHKLAVDPYTIVSTVFDPDSGAVLFVMKNLDNFRMMVKEVDFSSDPFQAVKF